MHKHRLQKVLAVLMALVFTLSLAACSGKDAAKNEESATTIVYGEVTAIDGSDITLALGTLNDQSIQKTPSGSAMPSPSGDNANSPSPDASMDRGNMPSDNGLGSLLTKKGETAVITITDIGVLTKQSGNRPDGKTGTPFDNGSGETGEVPDTSATARTSAAPTTDAQVTPGADAATDGSNGSQTTTASLSDITVGSVLMITYQGDKIISIVILRGTSGDNPGGGLKPTGRAEGTGGKG